MQFAIYDESTGLFFQGATRSWGKRWGATPKVFRTVGQARGYRNSYVVDKKTAVVVKIEIKVVETYEE